MSHSLFQEQDRSDTLFSAENLSFYVDAMKLQRIPEEEVPTAAKSIVSKYIKAGSLYEVNIDSKTRKQIMETTEYHRDMFASAYVSIC